MTTNCNVIISSGRSRIYVLEDTVQKVYTDSRVDTSIEHKRIEIINTHYLVRVISSSPNIIQYERITPITRISEFKSRDTIFALKMLIDIAIGLSYIHRKGYVHKDVARGNIGIRNSCKSFVLYDTEDLCIGSSQEMYQDVMMFIEDMLIHYQANNPFSNLLYDIQNILRRNVKTEYRSVSFLGKTRQRSYEIPSYSAMDFVKTVYTSLS